MCFTIEGKNEVIKDRKTYKMSNRSLVNSEHVTISLTLNLKKLQAQDGNEISTAEKQELLENLTEKDKKSTRQLLQENINADNANAILNVRLSSAQQAYAQNLINKTKEIKSQESGSKLYFKKFLYQELCHL